MARKPKALVLDTWSVIAYLEGEAVGTQLADIIADAHEEGVPIMMSVLTVAEVWELIFQNSSSDEADQLIIDLRQLGILFVEVSWQLAREAARFKLGHHMTYSNCLAASLAKQEKAEIVTGDNEFREVKADVRIRWLQDTVES